METLSVDILIDYSFCDSRYVKDFMELFLFYEKLNYKIIIFLHLHFD